MNTQFSDDLKQLRDSGNVALSIQYDRMASALRVIQVWAAFDVAEGTPTALDPQDVVNVTEKALKRFR